MPAESFASKPDVHASGGPAMPWARGARWAVGATSGLLLLMALTGWLCYRAQSAHLAADHLRLQVTGPARMGAGIARVYLVTTTSIAGQPVSARIEFAILAPDATPLMVHKEKTDEHGRLTVAVSAELDFSAGATLEVTARHDDKQESAVLQLAAEPGRYATHLTLDKPCYRPGETIHYRWQTLSRFDFSPAADMPLRFHVLDPGRTVVAGSQAESVGRRGAGAMSFLIPEGFPGGTYTLVARNVDGAFPDQRKSFLVRRYRRPRLRQKLELNRNSYRPGETVTADYSVHRVAGGLAAGARLMIAGTIDGVSVFQQEAEASSLGAFTVAWTLPNEMDGNEGRLTVVADDGGTRETIVRDILIRGANVRVDFCPEGGRLVAELENRVYFAARDHLGRPVELRGRVVNGPGRPVATVVTTHEGMGSFRLIPSLGGEYRLEIDGAAETQPAIRLPEVVGNRKIVLSTGLGVFESGKPLEFNIRAAEAGLPLVASAWCRGVLVGQQVVVTRQSEKANPVVLNLDENAAGVIRLVIHRYSSHPPELVAERLVFRRPARRLRIRVDKPGTDSRPGEPTDIPLRASDEQGNPVRATLDIRRIDEALLTSGDGATRSLPARLLLATELERPENWENLDFYLRETAEATLALDLLLGVQRWRQFLENKLDTTAEDDPNYNRLARQVALDGKATPPAVSDNLGELLGELQRRYRGSSASQRAPRTRLSDRLTALSFFGGLGLLVFVALLNLLNIDGGARLWVPAILVTAVCLTIGSRVTGPSQRESSPDPAAAFIPFDATPDPDAASSDATSSDATEENTAKPTADGPRPNPNKDATNTPKAGPPGTSLCDAEGRARARVDTSGPVARFRLLVDGRAEGGRIGSGQGSLVVERPFRIEPLLPLEVGCGDRIDLPLAVLNNTDDDLSVELFLEPGPLLQIDGDAQKSLEVGPGECVRGHFALNVVGPDGDARLTFRATAGQRSHQVIAPVRVVMSGASEKPPESDATVDPDCPVQLSTRLGRSQVGWGDVVTLAAELVNTTDQSQPAPVTVLGLPAGLEVRLDQLDRLERAGIINHYETGAREVVLYWQTLDPEEEIRLTLDLIAAIPGKYTSPASRASLHDTPDREHQNAPLTIEITPN